MSKEKEGNKNSKKPAAKNLKEKRAAKRADRNSDNKINF